MIFLCRVYDPPPETPRYLVDRLWPRGVKRQSLALTGWLKEAAPSHELRRWFHAHPDDWETFTRRYFDELDANPESWQSLAEAAARGDITLLYASKNTERNNAAALKEYLLGKLEEK